MNPRALQYTLGILIAISLGFIGGFLSGGRWHERQFREQLSDRELSIKATELHKDITTLFALREPQAKNLAADLELWVVERTNSLNLKSVSSTSASSAVLRETANQLVAYQKRYPSSILGTAKSEQLSQLATFAGPSAFPGSPSK